MIIFIPFILIIGSAHFIISVTPSNSIVSVQDQLTVKVLTSANIASNTLTITLPIDFVISAPCLVNTVTSTCTYANTGTSVTATFSSIFSNGLNYNLTLTVTNPNYASNFLVNAAVSGSNFANTGIATITPKTIACSLTPSSSIVGEVTTGVFTIGNDALPANSIITINTTLQTTFNNLFVSSPSCLTSNSPIPCSVSTNFGQQFLTITSVPTSANLIFSIMSINNPPYNGTFMDIYLQIQNSNNNYMQVCNFKQQAVSILRNSSQLAFSGWNNQVGATSTVTITVNTYFTPYTTNLMFVYIQNLVMTAFSPASSTNSLVNNLTHNYVTSSSAVGKSLTFTAQITNPSSKQPIPIQVYVAYSNIFFVEQFSTSTIVLSQLILTMTHTATNYQTMSTSIYNSSVNIPYLVTGGFVISLYFSLNSFQCSNLGLSSSITLTVVSCQPGTLILSSSFSLPQGTLWITNNVINYYSLKSNNLITLNISGPTPTSYPISTSTSSINLIINSQSYTIINSVTTFAAATNISIVEQSTNINSSTIRIFTFQLPSDIQLSSNTMVMALNSSSILTLISVNANSHTITVSATGPLYAKITGINNPIKYQGSLTWIISATDSLNNPSSSSTVQQQPAYTSTTLTVNYALSSTVIQTQSNMTITIIPTLLYVTPPTITISLSSSLILTPCSTCTSQSSNSVSLTYSSAIIIVILGIKNSNNPIPNSIIVTIASPTINYQSETVNYALNPMPFKYQAFQSGLFGTIGTVKIVITSFPTQQVTVTYSSMNAILSSSTCVTCTNSLIQVSGIVQYFQTAVINITGTYNGLIYATSLVPIVYICQTIQGCRICANQTINNNQILVCQQCFDSTHTNFTLLYNNQCLQACPISTYSNTLTCVTCPALCYICTMIKCQQCVPNYYIYNNSCLETCPTGFINNATHCISVPIICPSNCINCLADNTCLACDSGFILLLSSCYTSCPLGYKQQGSSCILFIPPEQTQYFPFAFVISSLVIFMTLVFIKCFQKRSLIMGNLIAFVSIVEIGSIIMTLVYTLKQNSDLLTQSLCFILIFSKVLLNLIFLIYFLKVVTEQQNFLSWREGDESNQKLYKILIALSSTLSFQVIRIIYSRLMGLRLFFGKFNTSLIFKPLNYFTIAYFISTSFSLIFLSIRNIISQDGYRTSTYYTSVQTIIIELMLAICCLVDNKKGYDDQFFQYQIYKVNNEYESSHVEPVEIEYHAENAGSMHEMINAVQTSLGRKMGAQIVKNPMWVKALERQKVFKNQEVQSMEELIEEKSQKQQKQKQTGVIENKRQTSLFRKKIIDDWRKIEKSLPNKLNQLRKISQQKRISKFNNSFSPDQKNNKIVQKSLKRVSSMQKIQVKLPEYPVAIPDKIKQYFYNIGKSKVEQYNIEPSKMKNSKFKKQEPKSATLEVEVAVSDQIHSQFNAAIHQNERKQLQIQQSTKFGQRFDNKQPGQLVTDQIQLIQDEGQNHYRILKQNKQNIFNSKSEDQNIEEDYSQEDDEQYDSQNNHQINGAQSHQRFLRGSQNQIRQVKTSQGNRAHFANQKNNQEPIGIDIQMLSQEPDHSNAKKNALKGYRYEGEDKQKKYRTKKRRVNRQTEEVYLQRLVGSSEKKVRSRPRKLQF